MVTLLLIVIYVAFISLGLPDALLGVAWPIMQVEFNTPVSLAGLVSMVVSANTIISSVMSGRVLKRFGTGRVTFVSVLMTAVALLGISLSPGFIWLVLLGIPLGLGAGSVDAGLNDYVAKNYKAHHMSWLHSFWGVGAMTGPVIISHFIAGGESWRNGYLTVAIIQFGLVVLLFLTLPIWSKIARTKQQPASEPAPIKPEVLSSKPIETERNIFSPLSIPGVKPVLIVFLFYCGIESTMGLWGSSFLTRVKGIDVATAASWVSLFFGSIMVGRFASGFITMRVSSKNLIRGGALSILAGVILFLLPLPEAFSILSFMLIGLGCAPIFPTMLHETPNRFGNEDAQNIMGFQMAVAYIGASLLPPIFGVIASVIGFEFFPLFLLAYVTLMLFNSEQINRFMARKQPVSA